MTAPSTTIRLHPVGATTWSVEASDGGLYLHCPNGCTIVYRTIVDLVDLVAAADEHRCE